MTDGAIRSIQAIDMGSRKNRLIRMLSYFRPFVGLVALAGLMAVIVNVAELVSPYIMKIAIDDYIMGDNADMGIGTIAVLYFASVAVGSVSNYAHTILLNTIVQKIIHAIRMELFSHIQRMPMSFFDRHSSGRILTRVTNDVEALNEMYAGVLVALFRDILLLIGITVAMFSLSVKLAIVSFSVVPVIVLVTFFFKPIAVANYRRVRALIAQINGFLAENLSGMRIVQIFNRQKEKYREFRELNDKYNEASLIDVKLMGFFRPSAELINNLGISILIWYCAPSVLQSTLEVGMLYAFITYIKKFFWPINDLADKVNVMLSGMVSADRIFEIMDTNEGIEDLDLGSPISDVQGRIEFRNVWFAYKGEDWVLKDVSFTIEPGQTVAFVGATGSGKTTIINLIGRFYEIQKGQILLDGVDIREYKLRDLRSRIAVVMQDVFLFSGDIVSNIRLDNESITDEDAIRAAQYVNAHQFIEELPNRYNEEVHERGSRLSTGQKQLLSFARAIAFNPSILVLDEATANIDTETEKVIQESLAKISKNRTTLIIAHRLSTIKNADKIIVIHKGRIREIGRHDELLAKKGIYHDLYQMQYAWAQ